MESGQRVMEFWSYRWCAPVTAALADNGRFSTLMSATGVSRDALSRTLVRLETLRIMQRNTGYGHPLRPEYFLTGPGARISSACQRLLSESDASLHPVLLKKWSMPCLAIANRDGNSFSDLRARLESITPRALSQTLDDLVACNLFRVHQPSPRAHRSYVPTERAHPLQDLARQINALIENDHVAQ